MTMTDNFICDLDRRITYSTGAVRTVWPSVKTNRRSPLRDALKIIPGSIGNSRNIMLPKSCKITMAKTGRRHSLLFTFVSFVSFRKFLRRRWIVIIDIWICLLISQFSSVVLLQIKPHSFFFFFFFLTFFQLLWIRLLKFLRFSIHSAVRSVMTILWTFLTQSHCSILLLPPLIDVGRTKRGNYHICARLIFSSFNWKRFRKQTLIPPREAALILIFCMIKCWMAASMFHIQIVFPTQFWFTYNLIM